MSMVAPLQVKRTSQRIAYLSPSSFVSFLFFFSRPPKASPLPGVNESRGGERSLSRNPPSPDCQT